MLGGAGFLPSTVPSNHPPKIEQAYMALVERFLDKNDESWSVFFRYIPWNWQILASENRPKLHFKKGNDFFFTTILFQGRNVDLIFVAGGFDSWFSNNPFWGRKTGCDFESISVSESWGDFGKTNGWVYICLYEVSWVGSVKKDPRIHPKKNTGGWFHQPKKGWVRCFFVQRIFWIISFWPPWNYHFFWLLKIKPVGNSWKKIHTRCAPTSYKWDHTPYKYRFITPVTHL